MVNSTGMVSSFTVASSGEEKPLLLDDLILLLQQKRKEYGNVPVLSYPYDGQQTASHVTGVSFGEHIVKYFEKPGKFWPYKTGVDSEHPKCLYLEV